MSDSAKSLTAMRWVRQKSGSAPPELYANCTQASWTVYDLRLQLGSVVPSEADPNDLVVENVGAVTISWQACEGDPGMHFLSSLPRTKR